MSFFQLPAGTRLPDLPDLPAIVHAHLMLTAVSACYRPITLITVNVVSTIHHRSACLQIDSVSVSPYVLVCPTSSHYSLPSNQAGSTGNNARPFRADQTGLPSDPCKPGKACAYSPLAVPNIHLAPKAATSADRNSRKPASYSTPWPGWEYGLPGPSHRASPDRCMSFNSYHRIPRSYEARNATPRTIDTTLDARRRPCEPAMPILHTIIRFTKWTHKQALGGVMASGAGRYGPCNSRQRSKLKINIRCHLVRFAVLVALVGVPGSGIHVRARPRGRPLP